jgi:hypothetical protein
MNNGYQGIFMEKSQLEQCLQKVDEYTLRSALNLFFAPHTSSVFGAAKAVEHEVAALNALKLLGFIPVDADEFELVERLRVTKPKARSLLYQAALREKDGGNAVENSLRAVLSNPRIKREGEFFLIEVPQPLTMDRLRARVRSLGFISDGTFSAGVAKIPEEALVALVDTLMLPEQKSAVLDAMKKQGMTDTSFQGVLKSALRKAGTKFAGQAGDELMSCAGDIIGQVFSDASVKYLSPYIAAKSQG